MPTYYHGGRVGRCVGDLILPPAITKVPFVLFSDMQRVFITTMYPTAVWYAVRRALLLGEEVGKVYSVEPNGPLSVDPWGPCKTVPDAWYCESATVLEVISPSVEDVMQEACKMQSSLPKLVGFDQVLHLEVKYRKELS